MFGEQAGHRCQNLNLPNCCGNDQKRREKRTLHAALNERGCQELLALLADSTPVGWAGICQGGLSWPGPGRCILIPSAPLGSRCPQQCRLQATTGTDGSARRTRLRTCNGGSCHQWAVETLLGLIRGCSVKGAGGRLNDHPSDSALSPGFLDWWGQTRVNVMFHSFFPWAWGLRTAVSQGASSCGQARVNTHPETPADLKKPGSSTLKS